MNALLFWCGCLFWGGCVFFLTGVIHVAVRSLLDARRRRRDERAYFIALAEQRQLVGRGGGGYGVGIRWNAGPDVAHARSMALLRLWLSPQQLVQFENTNSFEVVGSATGRTYIIFVTDVSFNVRAGDDLTLAWCFEPLPEPEPNYFRRLPLGDRVLGQKIMLECAEQDVLCCANFQMMGGPWGAERYSTCHLIGARGRPVVDDDMPARIVCITEGGPRASGDVPGRIAPVVGGDELAGGPR